MLERCVVCSLLNELSHWLALLALPAGTPDSKVLVADVASLLASASGPSMSGSFCIVGSRLGGMSEGHRGNRDAEASITRLMYLARFESRFHSIPLPLANGTWASYACRSNVVCATVSMERQLPG